VHYCFLLCFDAHGCMRLQWRPNRVRLLPHKGLLAYRLGSDGCLLSAWSWVRVPPGALIVSTEPTPVSAYLPSFRQCGQHPGFSELNLSVDRVLSRSITLNRDAIQREMSQFAPAPSTGSNWRRVLPNPERVWRGTSQLSESVSEELSRSVDAYVTCSPQNRGLNHPGLLRLDLISVHHVARTHWTSA
jgi:hypothetical protein